MTTGAELKITGFYIKTLLLPILALKFSPIYDWIVLQMVTDYSLLNPFQKGLINDSKSILGVFVVLFALIKLILGTIKIIKELKAKKDPEEK